MSCKNKTVKRKSKKALYCVLVRVIQPLSSNIKNQLTWSVIWSRWLFSYCTCAGRSFEAAKKWRQKMLNKSASSQSYCFSPVFFPSKTLPGLQLVSVIVKGSARRKLPDEITFHIVFLWEMFSFFSFKLRSGR